MDPLQALAGTADVQVMVAPLGKAFYGDVRSKRMVSPLKKPHVHAIEELFSCVHGSCTLSRRPRL